MKKTAFFCCVALPLSVFADLVTLEDKLNEQIDTVYCSAILEYINSGSEYDKIKSHNLIKKAESINKTLHPSERADVIQFRIKYIDKLRNEDTSKEIALDLFNHLKCDLKV